MSDIVLIGTVKWSYVYALCANKLTPGADSRVIPLAQIDLPNYSDLSNTSSYRLDNNDLEHLRAENGGTINGATTTAPTLKKKTISNWRKCEAVTSKLFPY